MALASVNSKLDDIQKKAAFSAILKRSLLAAAIRDQSIQKMGCPRWQHIEIIDRRRSPSRPDSTLQPGKSNLHPDTTMIESHNDQSTALA